ncbi:MAG: hypothetical protein ACLPYS_04475 [Vulcanimicrobiaceae bacterium]
MALRKSAQDPLARALDEAPVPRKDASRGEVCERQTPHTQPVIEALETLQAQVIGAMSGTFFDEGATARATPVKKRVGSEAGTVAISAKRHDPNVRVSVEIDVRCDHDEKGEAGHYQVRAQGRVGRKSNGELVESEFPVAVEVRDSDGSLNLKLDSDGMREEIANAIRSTGTPR